MRKKLLSILLVLSLMLALVPAAFAADAVRTELESDGTTLAFYGSGVATADCWNGDWTAVTHVDLGYEIRGVAENVLARCVNLGHRQPVSPDLQRRPHLHRRQADAGRAEQVHGL